MAKGNERERREKERKREESARLFLARNTREVSFLVGNPSMKGEIWHTAGRNGRNRDGRWDAGWILTSACVSQYPSRPKLDFRNFPESGPPPWRRFTSLSVYWPPRNPLRNFILASGKNGTPLLSPLSISACSFERFNERKGKGQVWKRTSLTKSWRRRRWRSPRTWTARTRSSTSSISPENREKTRQYWFIRGWRWWFEKIEKKILTYSFTFFVLTAL